MYCRTSKGHMLAPLHRRTHIISILKYSRTSTTFSYNENHKMQVCNDFKCMWRGAAPNIDEQMLEFENIKIHGHSAAEQNSWTHIWWLWVQTDTMSFSLQWRLRWAGVISIILDPKIPRMLLARNFNKYQILEISPQASFTQAGLSSLCSSVLTWEFQSWEQ